MRKIPSVFYKATTQIWFYVGIALFFLAFIVLYEPSDICFFFDTPRQLLTLNELLLSAIILVVLSISRNLMFILRKNLQLTWIFYIMWCVAEIIVMAAFMGLYMSLISLGYYTYFAALGYCFGYLLEIVSYPYVFITLVFVLLSLHEKSVDEDALIRFYDNTGKLKLVVASAALLFIEAQENYVKIHYQEGQRLKDYTLRNTMRSLEELADKHGLVRCQRSFYVNPLHVRVLRRDKEGVIMAELDTVESKPIPVSPRYYEKLSKLL